MMRCDDSRLKLLLRADESSAEYLTTANHVETCTFCQKRLAQITGDEELLSVVRETLLDLRETEPFQPAAGSSVFISVGASAQDEFGADCEPVSLEFLGSPSHPEMLGRIGRYDVERMIGSGGMGIVLKGFDTELHRVVAVKVLKPHLAHNGAARNRFAREAQSAAAVVHEHVIPIYDVQSDSDLPFLVMQYVQGQSLQARVDSRGPLEPKEVLRIAMQAAAGLAAAHAQGLVHRDVKPANILMEDTVERVVISDFGLARTVDDATLTRTGIVAGTPHYMSPEQAAGQSVDHRSDLFSLGSTIYFMCTGRPPFRAQHALAILNRICRDPHRPVDEVNSDVPAELAEVVDRLLAKDPNDRFHNAHEVEKCLQAILSQQQTGRRSVRLRWRRGWQRRRAIVMKTASNFGMVAACVLAGVGLSPWFWPVQSTPESSTAVQTQQRTDEIVSTDQSTNDKIAPKESAVGGVSEAFAPDNFMDELEEVRVAVSELETRLDRTNRTSSVAPSFDNEWQKVLEQVQSTIQILDPVKSRQNPNFPSDQTSPVERIEP